MLRPPQRQQGRPTGRLLRARSRVLAGRLGRGREDGGREGGGRGGGGTGGSGRAGGRGGGRGSGGRSSGKSDGGRVALGEAGDRGGSGSQNSRRRTGAIACRQPVAGRGRETRGGLLVQRGARLQCMQHPPGVIYLLLEAPLPLLQRALTRALCPPRGAVVDTLLQECVALGLRCNGRGAAGMMSLSPCDSIRMVET